MSLLVGSCCTKTLSHASSKLAGTVLFTLFLANFIALLVCFELVFGHHFLQTIIEFFLGVVVLLDLGTDTLQHLAVATSASTTTHAAATHHGAATASATEVTTTSSSSARRDSTCATTSSRTSTTCRRQARFTLAQYIKVFGIKVFHLSLCCSIQATSIFRNLVHTRLNHLCFLLF